MDLESLLIKNLHRVLCPDPVELGEYQMGTLHAQQAEAIQIHLEECARCRSELQLLVNYFNDLKPDIEYSLGERVKVWIARLLPPPGPALAFGVRGGEDGDLLHYGISTEETGAELEIEIQEDTTHPGRKVILGFLAGISGKGLLAALWQTGQSVAEAAVDDFGNLALVNLLPGEYDLVIRGEGFEIYVQNLKV
jgi:hypothetical protein